MQNDESVTTVKSNLCACSHVETKKISEYVYGAIEGLTLILHDVVTHSICPSCKEESYYIPNRRGLEAAAVIHRASIGIKLSAPEIKFFRKTMRLPSKELAEILDISPEHMSRIENEKIPMSNLGEKILRLLAVRQLREAAPLMKVDETKILEMKIKTIRPDATLKLHFTIVAHRPKEVIEEAYVEQLKQAA